jgi:cbb3-type cytochrome oxidase subunit 3
MKLSDVLSHLHLTAYPILALMLFLSVFVGVVLQVLGRARRDEFDRAGLLPLADDAAVPSKERRP